MDRGKELGEFIGTSELEAFPTEFSFFIHDGNSEFLIYLLLVNALLLVNGKNCKFY